MRKLLPYILILVVAIGLFSPVAKASAQEAGGPIVGVAATAIELALGDCSFATGSLANCINNVIFARVAWFLMTIMSWCLWLAGTFLDFVIDKTILTMATDIAGMTGINIGWKIIRDMMNIAFIFLLVYEGVKMIIGQSDLNKVKKFVSMIVLSSLLINFSLFFTKILIDASNVVTVGVYNSMVDSSSKANIPGGTGTGYRPMSGLSAPFMNSLNLSNFYGTQTFNQVSAKVGGGTSMFILYAMGTIIFLVTTFVFLAIACMLVIRYVTLIVLLMLSPVAYMGMALPGMSKYSSDWWKSLNGQLLFAPVYMIMTSVILTLMSSDGFIVRTAGNWGDVAAGTNNRDTMGLLLNFVVIIGLIITSLVVAKSFATQGSKFIGDSTGKLTAFAGGVAMGGVAGISRNVVGRAALSGTNVAELEARAANGDRGAKTRLALAKGSFDVRRSSAGEAIAKQTGVDFGKGIPFKPKAGEGGQAGTMAEKKKGRDDDVEKITKYYVDKRDWAGLATAMKSRPPMMTTKEWETRQGAMYKKLSGRDKISLDKALGDPTLTGTLRSKLPLDEQIKMYTDNKEWVQMATFILAKSDQEQDYVYEKMSARDRVELGSALKATPAGTTANARMKMALSVEEQEKTDKIEGEVSGGENNRKTREFINAFATGTLGNIDPKTGVAYSTYHPDVPTAIQKLKPSEARKLKDRARKDPVIIPLLTVRHLADLMDNGDLLDDQITAIRASATPTQTAWMNDPFRISNWTV